MSQTSITVRQLARFTSIFARSQTLKSGSLVVDADAKQLRLHDGVKPGGLAIGIAAEFDVRQYGFIGSGLAGDATADTTAIKQAISAAQAATLASETLVGRVIIPAGYRPRINSQIVNTVPIEIDCGSVIYTDCPNGSALRIGAAKGTANSGWNVRIAGLRDVSTARNTGAPGPSGTSTGIEIVGMQYSRMNLGPVQAYSYAGIYCNSTNNLFSGQHTQQNIFVFSNLGYNRVGLLGLSVDAEVGAVQANDITIDSVNANYCHVQFDESGKFNTNNNWVKVNAAEGTSGGEGFDIWGINNRFDLGFLNSRFRCRPSSFYNRAFVLNNQSNGASFLDDSNNNFLRSGMPDASILPTSATITKGALMQNLYGVPVFISLSAALAAGDTASAYIGNAMGSLRLAQQATLANAGTAPLGFYVGPGRYYQINAPGSTTLSTALVQEVG